MSLNVLAHPLQPLTRQSPGWRESDCGRSDVALYNPRGQRCAQRLGEDVVEDPAVDLVGEGQRNLRNQGIVKARAGVESTAPPRTISETISLYTSQR